jgi:hypothetical protein
MAMPALGLLLAAEITIPDAYMPNKFQFVELCFFLVWAVWAVLNFWIWSKTKAQGNLLMLVGSGATALFWLISLFNWEGINQWLHFFALVTVTVGFFFTIKPLVEAQIAALKTKMQHMTAKKEGGGSPPPPAK